MSASFEREHREEVISREIVAGLNRACKHVLDIGVGNGELSRIVDGHCESVTAIDNKQESLNNLPTHMGTKGKEVEKIKGSILNIEIPNKAYDLIVLSHMLYYISNDERIKLIDKLYNFLSVKGRILIIYNDNGDRWALAEHFHGKNHDFSRTKAHIEKFDHDYYKFTDTIKTDNIEPMLHIAGVILDDADTTANKQELREYLHQHCFNANDELFQIEMTQNILLIEKMGESL